MRAHRFTLLLSGAFVFAVVGIWYAVFSFASDQNLTVAFLDVGQGDAIFIETPGGTQVLIDSGPDSSVVREVSEQMSFFDRSLDVILTTHPDKDHIGGFPAVLEHYTVSLALVPRVTAETDIYTLFKKMLSAERADIYEPLRGKAIALGPNTTLTFLFPDRSLVNIDPNDASVIAKLTYGDTTFLLTGDAPDAVERYITILDKEMLDADVLKIGHHGSDTSTTLELLGYASPEYAVISAGADNRYGHPHTEVLAQLARFNVKTLGTYENGTIVFQSDGEEVEYISN